MRASLLSRVLSVSIAEAKRVGALAGKEYLSAMEVAAITPLQVRTLEKWRNDKRGPTGPPFTRFGNGPNSRVFYPREGLFLWLEAHKVLTIDELPFGQRTRGW
jgi:hypothetical protein